MGVRTAFMVGDMNRLLQQHWLLGWWGQHARRKVQWKSKSWHSCSCDIKLLSTSNILPEKIAVGESSRVAMPSSTSYPPCHICQLSAAIGRVLLLLSYLNIMRSALDICRLFSSHHFNALCLNTSFKVVSWPVRYTEEGGLNLGLRSKITKIIYRTNLKQWSNCNLNKTHVQ